MFKINFDTLIKLLLPVRMRGTALVALLRSLIAPLESLYNQFIIRREDTLLLLKYDASKRNMELALRKQFKDNGIYIQNATTEIAIEPAYLNEEKPLWLNFYIDKEITTDDFIVFVPLATHNANAQAIHDFTGYFALPAFNYSVRVKKSES
jgi:hypothetical protein